MNTKQNQPSPKAKQFNEELNELCKKYQYVLVPQLKVTASGIVPWLAIRDIVPPKQNEKPIKLVKPEVKKPKIIKPNKK